MPKRFRMTRRLPVALTEDAHRRLRRFAEETGLPQDEAMSFLFENLDALLDAPMLASRLRRFTGDLEERKL